MSEPDPGGRQVVDVTDMDLAAEVLAATYTAVRLDATGEAGGIRLVTNRLGPVGVDSIAFRMALRAEVSPLQTHVFGHVTAGRLRYTSRGVERDHLPGDVALTALPEDAVSVTADHAAVEYVVIGADQLAEVAAPAPGRPEAVVLTGYRPVSPEAATGWRRSYAFVRDHVLGNPGYGRHPLVVGNAVRLLCASALATFPSTAIVEPTAVDRHDAHPETLRRAIAFIEANADRDITAADVAGAASVTIRAIQLAFRRHLDTTPMRYLRQVRLDSARSELRAASPDDGSTVTEVASRWGYSRPGVFASRYREAFGESPSRTLRER